MIQNCDSIIKYSDKAYLYANTDSLCDFTVRSMIDEVKSCIDIHSNSIESIIDSLDRALLNKIETYLLTYNRDELMIALLSLKATLRSRMSSHEVTDDFDISTRHEEILHLINIVIFTDNSKFKNKSLLHGSKNLALTFRLAYFYNVFQDNVKHIRLNNAKHYDIDDFFKAGIFYNDQIDKYFDTTLDTTPDIEIPEESRIKSQVILDYMKKIGCDFESIQNSFSVISKTHFGFDLSELNLFIFYGLRQVPPQFLIAEYKENYSALINVSIEAVESIINVFSLNRVVHFNNKLLDTNRLIELRSIYEIGDKIIFLPFDLVYNYSCFEKMLIKRHFVEYFSVSISELNNELERALDKIEERISSFISYVLVDRLLEHGYKLPMKNKTPCAEIKSIPANNVNILKNKGDIDVLALDSTKKQIFNFELKFYKPLLNIEEVNSNHKIDERRKNITKLLERQRLLEDNIKFVIEYFGESSEDADAYIVRSILVSPRPDYWMMQLKGKDGTYDYYHWSELIRRIEGKII